MRSMHRSWRVAAPLGVAVALTAWAVVCGSGQVHAQESTPAASPGQWTEGVPCEKDPTQTYSLYLPSHFDPQHNWPALMIFDPRGRSLRAGERFERAAETLGWVLVSSNDTRSDEAWDPNSKALRALWPEVHSRYSIDPHRIYGAGFSGGVLVAWYLAQLAEAPTLAGILSAGGRPADEIPVARIAFAHFGTAGAYDFNYQPMKALDAIAAQRGADHQLQFFRGRHQWMSEALAYEGMEWMEILAMRDQLRTENAAFLEEAYGRYLQHADSLESHGQELQALRRYELIASSWKGLRDLRAVHKRVERLHAAAAVRDQQALESETDQWELDKQQELLPLLGALENGINERSWQDLVEDLRLEDIQEQAQSKAPSLESDAAQRVLEWTFARTSFYIHRQLLAAGNPAQAAVALHIAAFIHPQLSYVWYNLAGAHALAEQPRQANQALGKAVDNGFSDRARLQSDPDLASIRSTEDYRKTVARLR